MEHQGQIIGKKRRIELFLATTCVSDTCQGLLRFYIKLNVQSLNFSVRNPNTYGRISDVTVRTSQKEVKALYIKLLI